MKKALAIILSLIMVLAMVPFASADGISATLINGMPANGDKVVIYNPDSGKALGACGTAASYYNEGVSIAAADGAMSGVAESIIWDCTIDAAGNYLFSQNGKYLSMGASYASTPYDDVNKTWLVEAFNGGYSIQNIGRSLWLEWYASSNYFSGYYRSDTAPAPFTFAFYKVPDTFVSPPTASPNGGTIAKGATVTLTSATADAVISYSFDNVTFTAYTAPVAIDADCTLYAYAKKGDATSDTASFTFTVYEGCMSIKDALTAGTVEEASVVGQIAYRFGNFGSINSAVIQANIDGEIYALQCYNALESDTEGNALAIGDWVVLTGKLGAYGGVQQIQSMTAIRKAAASEKIGSDAKDPQVYEDFASLTANFANLMTEYVVINNVTLGEYSATGSTTMTDKNGVTMPVYRGAVYPVGVVAGDKVNLYCCVSAYGTTKQLRNGESTDYYPLTDTQGPVITRTNTADGEVGQPYNFEVTVVDGTGVASVKMEVYSGATKVYETAMTAEGDTYRAAIAGTYVTGALDVKIIAADVRTPANTTTETYTLSVIDLPQVISYTPAANEATGANKKPVISVTFANAGTNPTIAMTLNGAAVTATVSGNTASYTPSANLSDGKYAVEVIITRADGKTAEASWSFVVGEATYSLYFGELHSHTAEYSDGTGTLEQAYDHAKYEAKQVDFLAVTDHSNYFDTSSNLGSMTDPTKGTKTADGTQTKWQEARATAASYTDDTFVAIYGYEMTWSGQYGHMNTFNSIGFESRNNSTYTVKNGPGLVAYYDRLVAVGEEDKTNGRASTINQFNHPGTTFGTFEDFAHYTPAYDEYITMVEVGNGEGKVGGSMYWPSYQYYTMALDKGWHVAPTNNQDNHKGGWGDSNTCRDVIYTDNFSEAGIYQAMRDMTMYATEDNDLEIVYTLNDKIMGSVLSLNSGDKLNIKVEFSDPTDRISKISVIANGDVTVAKKSFSTKSGTWEIELDNNYSYYYIRVDEVDGDIAVTAPVWTSETTKIGVSPVTKDTVADYFQQEITFTLPVYNYEEIKSGEAATAADFKITQIEWVITGPDGETKTIQNPKFDGTDTNVLTPDMNDASYVWKYEPPKKEGRYTLTVTVTGTYRDAKQTFSSNISFNVKNPASTAKMLIDAGHANFYISGNYADSDTAFIELAANYNVRAAHLTEPITDAALEGCDLLVLTVPFRGASLAVSDVLYTADELAALQRYAAAGGNFIVCSKSDRLEPTNQAEWASTISNGILDAIGAKARVGKGIVADVVNNTNEAYRLHFTGKEFYNFSNPLCEYLIENTNLMFSCYNAAPIILNGAEPVVTAFDTSFVSSFADYFSGSSYKPNPDTEKSSYYYNACGDQDDVVVLAYEELPAGGFCITSGVTFFSTFEVKVEVESAATLQNTNYQIVVNLFKLLNPSDVTPIAKIHDNGKTGKTYTIEGYVTSNASGYDKDTAFFDCIYLQDDSGRGINVFPVAGRYEIGQKLRITGMTSEYMGEIELNCGNDYGGEIQDITLRDYAYTDEAGVVTTGYATHAKLLDVEITLANKQTIETYVIDDTRMNVVLDAVSAANKAAIVEAAAGVSCDTDLLAVTTCAGAMASRNIGNLVEIYGKVTKVEYDENGVIGTIYVKDSSGTAIVFLDGYIGCDCADCTKDDAGYHDLSAIVVGANVRVRGIASKGQNSYTNSERIGSRIRIRNRADIEVWNNEVPKTGEQSNIVWIGIVMLIALMGVCTVAIVRRRYNH